MVETKAFDFDRKVQLIKTFVISKLVYVSSLTPAPLWVFEELNQLIFYVSWNGNNKIKRDIVYLDYNRGMTDFQLFIRPQRIMWIIRLIYGESTRPYAWIFSWGGGGKIIYNILWEKQAMARSARAGGGCGRGV